MFHQKKLHKYTFNSLSITYTITIFPFTFDDSSIRVLFTMTFCASLVVFFLYSWELRLVPQFVFLLCLQVFPFSGPRLHIPFFIVPHLHLRFSADVTFICGYLCCSFIIFVFDFIICSFCIYWFLVGFFIIGLLC